MIGLFNLPYYTVQPPKFFVIYGKLNKLVKLFEYFKKQLLQKAKKIFCFWDFDACQSFVAVEPSA